MQFNQNLERRGEGVEERDGNQNFERGGEGVEERDGGPKNGE